MGTLDNVYQMLEQLNATSKVNDKIDLLVKFIQDPLFLKTVKYTLDPNKNYHIKQLPPVTKGNRLLMPTKNLEKELFKFLKTLAKKTGTTKQEKQQLADFSWDSNDYDVISRIVKKDLRCGVSTALINRVVSGSLS